MIQTIRTTQYVKKYTYNGDNNLCPVGQMIKPGTNTTDNSCVWASAINCGEIENKAYNSTTHTCGDKCDKLSLTDENGHYLKIDSSGNSVCTPRDQSLEEKLNDCNKNVNHSMAYTPVHGKRYSVTYDKTSPYTCTLCNTKWDNLNAKQKYQCIGIDPQKTNFNTCSPPTDWSNMQCAT